MVVTTYTIHLPQDSYSSKSEQGLNIGPTHSPGRREAAELSTEILDQFLEFIVVLDLVSGLLGVLRVPGTDCGLVHGWLSVRQYVLLLSVLYSLVAVVVF